MVNPAEEFPFIVFSDDWGEHPSSCQHLFRRIARSHRVLWVNTIGMRNPSLRWGDFRKAVKKVRKMFFRSDGLGGNLNSSGNISVCQPPMLPYSNFKWVRLLNRFFVKTVVSGRLEKLSISDPVLVTTVPNASDYLGFLGEKLTVYYCVDDFAEWPGMNKEFVQSQERKLVNKADVFVATSDELYERLSIYRKPTYLLTHGVDLDLFSTATSCEHECLNGIPRPRVGYLGLFDKRSDQTMLVETSKRLPDYSFVITGPVDVDISLLKALPNIYFTGAVSYEDLPSVAKGLDVLFLPYLVNKLTRSISPLKLKEYLATGKPIVSTPLAEVFKAKDYIFIGSSVDEITDAITHCLVAPISECIEKKRSYLQQENWQVKADQLVEICKSKLIK